MEDLLTTKTLASTMIIRTAIAIILEQVVLVNGGVHKTEPEIKQKMVLFQVYEDHYALIQVNTMSCYCLLSHLFDYSHFKH